MDSAKILKEVRKELSANIEEKYRSGSQRFFKEKVPCYGVKTPIVRKIAKKHLKKIKRLDKREIFALCEELFKAGYNEEATIAIQWVGGICEQFENADFTLFEQWLTKYIDNWAKNDDFCLHVIQPMIERYPELIGKVKAWSHSVNMWLRRASAVSFVSSSGGFYVCTHSLKDIFEVAQTLMYDKEDLVQKGYGWMLKAASIHNQQQVFEFVMKHKATMPRTALRYAIEKMPADLKERAMHKD